MCAALQASQRLVQLSLAVLERFGMGISSSSSSAAYGNGIAPAAASSSSSSSSKATAGQGLVVMASASSEYAAFAPLVVSTLKVTRKGAHAA